MYDQYVLGNEKYIKKGRFMKQSSWFSILSLIDDYDSVWHAHKFLAQQVADKLGKNKAATGRLAKELLAAVVPAGPSDSGASVAQPAAPSDKESYLAGLRKLRKQAGQAILLVPMLMNDHNLVNARIMLLCGRPAARNKNGIPKPCVC